MADREKVIQGIDICTQLDKKAECPYECQYKYDEWCMNSAMKDALELLKEQELVVRCKDCKNAEPAFDGKMSRCKIRGLRKNDWFCADGEHAERR